MTTGETAPHDGQVKVNLANQIAGIAAQVTSALRSGNADQRNALESKLALARDQLQQGTAPDGLIPFIDIMCGLLRGEDTSLLVDNLLPAYRAVYDQVIDETRQREDDSELTLGQVLDQVSHNAVLAIRQGTYAQRRLMANTLLKMQRESARRPDLGALIDFLEAIRALLQDEDWAPFASRLQGPFQERWEVILTALLE